MCEGARMHDGISGKNFSMSLMSRLKFQMFGLASQLYLIMVGSHATNESIYMAQ